MQFTTAVLIAALATLGPLTIVNAPSTGVNAVAMPDPAILRNNAFSALFKRHDGEHDDDNAKRQFDEVDNGANDPLAKRHHLTDGKTGTAGAQDCNTGTGKGGKGKRHHLTDGKGGNGCGGKKKGGGKKGKGKGKKGKGKGKGKSTDSSSAAGAAASDPASAASAAGAAATDPASAASDTAAAPTDPANAASDAAAAPTDPASATSDAAAAATPTA